jgi:serine/threonine-protein kinase
MESEYLQSVPQTETATHVARAITSTSAVEPGAPQQPAAQASPAVIEKLRTLCGGQIIGTLGSGGMADVYLTWNPRLEVYRAIKVIKPGQNPALLERFETEIRIFAKLEHPNIVRCYGVSDWHSLPVVEMEYVSGTSIEGVLRKKGPLTTPQALSITILTCRALHYAHSQTITIYGKAYKGVIHRDIKPANIMLSRSGRVKLADFGIARPTEVSIHTLDSGNVVGTLPYLAPEQLEENAELTARTDVFALGATLYEMISGKRAFPQRDIQSLIKAKTFGKVEPLAVSPQVPKVLVDAIAKAMATEPSERYATADAFGKDLEKCLRAVGVRDGYSHLRQLADSLWGKAPAA